jgi:signal transduction histidine kinase
MKASERKGAVLWRSGAFRLAAFHAAIFAVLVALLFGVTWWSVRGYVEQQLHAAASDELSELAGSVATAAPGSIASPDPDGVEHFGLFDHAGLRLAGDIALQPTATGDMRVAVLRAGGQGHRMRLLHVVQTRLSDGRQLVVGTDRHEADELLEQLGRAFLIACVIGVLAALVAGFISSRRYLRRVEAIAAVASEILDGRLETRLTVGARNDEIDQLSATLNATWQRIQSLLEGMRQVSTDIAHELRTPLAHLRFRLESAREAMSPENPARVAMDRSIADVDHVLAVFGALLRIAQIQSGQRRAGFWRLDLSQLVSAVVADVRPVVEDEGRQLRIDIRGGVSVVGDPTLLTQLLVNLIENALRHTPRGTALTVALHAEDGAAVLIVEDAGPGIPDDQRERVLQRLVRLDASRGSPGAGLGLALVKAITDLHQVELMLSDANPGLRITIRFSQRDLTEQ